jgi:sulfite reductase (NADPH) flavoprotein alpha-component
MLKAARALNTPDSDKDTRHVVIDLEGTGISYKPGDSLGVIPENDPDLVEGIIKALGAVPEAEVGDGNGHSRTLRAELLTRRDLRNPTDALFALLAEAATNKDEAVALSRLADGEDPAGDLETLDVLDVLERFPSARPDAKSVVEALDELQPRLYSISSSPTAHAGEVHLTVGMVHEEQRGRRRRGVASNHLGRVNGTAVPLQIYLQPSHGFALPEDDAKPVVMVGPGTGVAPFRAFLHERKAQGAKGKSWLFFGNA